ncbi:MAG: pyridoxal 5'-phosphate synthase glutaminase subunit PdxT [Acidimicrobiia bacterium]|nr:pyridoxal 5'-phosphate synthase glutaminase subunit PdxT [bacterium]MXZ07070.1 pyridoxal 5'-phosphate synthase glutaminase subunit PdxT [Acidimicrobiia bacterium]MCY3579424.1 pyridoxal 5'-phosphate synthase glutaminase subunit PdxT [bacterium]MCY3652175.1 pyridoxal 5'-phosphate synthase glutaminase subunit PdxT [bacterium]MDE0642629.1 pyridoxal 5'-phosphate synthase glutaminase subunit PdxT [bacterium]
MSERAAPRVGVLALQGDFREHSRMIQAAGAEPTEVRTRTDLESVEALIIPGGESTTIGRLADLYDLIEPLRSRIESGLPALGTCAGMIFLASAVTEGTQPLLGVLDMVVERNAFGRQNESFECRLDVQGWDSPLQAVFIRAPLVDEISPDIEVLARHNGRPVLVGKEHILACAFHPELTDDLRLHKMLINLIQEQ